MDDHQVESILDGLTPPQAEAVAHLDGPLLVLAGPGSGKTRVITRRVANLVANGIPAWSILAVTFTNKAAGEMRERIAKLVPANVPGRRGLTVTTFHSLCARLLRMYASFANVPEAYSIYDSADQRSAIKQALKRAELDTKNWSPYSVLSQISKAKNKLITPEDYKKSAHDFYTRTIALAYENYQAILNEAGALDFDDLLMNVAIMLRDVEEVRVELQERYQYLLIDEYQDTNHVQFMLSHTLAAAHRNICVVGDPDQSIYGWRGADIRNILDFENHYDEALTISLGQNFRSTKHIVAVADTLIQNNKQRKHKDLFTESEEGQRPRVIRCADEHHEAQIVMEEIQLLNEDHGMAWKDMAVMYRVNALSRVMEETLRNAGIPHVIARGTAFFDRKEIKDALAYIRLLSNLKDEISLRRIINVPTRGIGKTTIERIELFSFNNNCSLFEAACRVDEITTLNDRAKNAVMKFVDMIRKWQSQLAGKTSSDLLVDDSISKLAELVNTVVRESGLENMHSKNKTEEDIERIANLEELVSSAAEFVPPLEAGPVPSLQQILLAWLESIALVSDADMVDPENGAVTLMTLHAAKGLEFSAVFMIGLEEGLLPHFNSLDSEKQIEEERRLCYVGITRAMQRLQISSAAQRTQRGMRERTMASQFLKELPDDHIEQVDLASDFWDDYADGSHHDHDADDAWEDDANPFIEFKVGSQVRHPQFGIGRIESLERGRDHTRSKIAFAAVGTKTLILEYARLETV